LHQHPDEHPDHDEHPNTYLHSHQHSHSHPDQHAHEHSDKYAYPHSHQHTYAHLHFHRHLHGHQHTHSHAHRERHLLETSLPDLSPGGGFDHLFHRHHGHGRQFLQCGGERHPAGQCHLRRLWIFTDWNSFLLQPQYQPPELDPALAPGGGELPADLSHKGE